MLSESGIDLEFDIFEEVEQDHRCYELKSKSLTRSSENPTVLMDPDVKIKPDPDDPSAARNNANENMTRTSFKLQMQREQILEIERKEQLKNLQQQQQQLQQQRFFPNSSATLPFSVPRTSTVQQRGVKAALPAMPLPSRVLKVETKLQNPTPHYLKQQQRRQVLEYLEQNQNNYSSGMPVSAPSNLQNFNFSSEFSSPSFLNAFSNPMSPASPDTVSSVASGGESDLWDDLFGEQDLSILAATLPTNTNLLETYVNSGAQNSEVDQQNVSSSCPANVKQEDNVEFYKERQKKDNHNMIERRRRYNINDRIKELGTLVPKLDNDMKQNKGTILKSSVDYIRRLKKDRERLKQSENRSQSLEEVNKKLMFRIQELELILRASNISTTLPEPDLSAATSPQLTQLLLNKQMLQQQQQQQLQQQQQQQHKLHQQQKQQLQQQQQTFMLQKSLANSQQTSTLHELLKAPPGTSSETVATAMSSSVDSPRMEDDDCVMLDE